MAHSNKVSPASPYLDEVRSGADEEPVRVGVAKSVGSLQIFAVGVSINGNSWLTLGAAILISFLDVFCSMAQFLQPSGLVAKDCKPALHGVMPQPMLLQHY